MSKLVGLLSKEFCSVGNIVNFYMWQRQNHAIFALPVKRLLGDGRQNINGMPILKIS